ncbi:hypothetical protein Acsp06_04180 [Actinomycetospora sp. NBRC 106375]|uniref:DUF1761 family protein n=1 Tax=Actinomycetospora sp. NBRC 106375 TaxID=3032207 RepID=UPI0024A0D8AC|nr:DUF1761 family protein [Actinomycetospora sp. NBRC 106375]GLZ44233.1 hypothetical protein Acsp06_04180 [Actinomycetospora sp. NBRC 106375]
MVTTATLIAVPAAAVAALVASGTYYGALGGVLARVRRADGPERSGGATAAVELARNVVLAAGVAVLLAAVGVAGVGAALLLAAGLWVAFPVVLLAGSVFHEGAPTAVAALHAGDWLIKLVIVLGTVALISA